MLEPEVQRIALSTMEALNCPRSLTVAILIKAGEHEQLARLKCEPIHYLDARSYFLAAQATDLLRKYPGLKTGLDKEAAAVSTFFEAEQQCARTNVRLAPYLNGFDQDERVLAFIERVRREVVHMIGHAPASQLELRFGPGATVTDRSGSTTVIQKLSSSPSLTPSASFVLSDWYQTAWARYRSEPDVTTVKGNIFFTVDKDSLTDRGCGKEPSLNVSYQLAAGTSIRPRLKRSGIDLEDGQAYHGRVVRSASKTGEVCTVDLSSASDTVARGLVKLLLPPAWYRLLDGLRSHFTRVNGRWYRLEKFSSMGNGFTFELETVIFTALARACVDEGDLYNRSLISVYGDDILIGRDHIHDLLAVLRFFGFTPNPRKTFVEGSFRESCGCDFFEGEDVRPFLLKDIPNAPQDYVSIANGLRRSLQKLSPLDDVRRGLLRAWFVVLDHIPSHVRSCRGPAVLGDVVIHDEPRTWVFKTKSKWPCVRFIRVYKPVRHREVPFRRFHPDAQFAAALYLAGKAPDKPARTPHGGLVPRDGVLGYGIGWVPFS